MSLRSLRLLVILVTSLALALLASNSVLAQQNQAAAAAAFLRRMDANRDGLLSPNEIPSRSRAAVERLANGARLDMNRPLPIDRLEREVRDQSGSDDDDDDRGRGRRGRGGDERGREGGREGWGRGRGERGGEERGRGRGERGRGRDDDERGRGDRRGRDDRRRGQEEEEAAAPPSRGFGNSESSSGTTNRGFGGTSSGGGSASMSDAQLNERYDERIIRYVDRFMSQYDKNKNGRLESSEWKDVRWGSDPSDSDTNKDGILTKAELCARMENRWGNNRRQSGGDRGSGRGDRNSRESSGGGGGDDDRVKRFVEGMLKRYDESGNGVLEKEEWGKMRSRYAAADANKDSVITKAELQIFLAKGSSESNSRDARSRRGESQERGRDRGRFARREESEPAERKSYRFLTPTERLDSVMSSRLRDDFVKLDANEDGQIAMAEFSSSWSASKVEEFGKLDSNRDGMITPYEYIENRSGGDDDRRRRR